MESKIVRRKMFIVGKVTGIGLRRKTVEYAEKLGVSGWITNNKNWKSVTIEAQGTEEQLTELQTYIYNLPNIKIKELHEQEIDVEENDSGFGCF